MSKEAPAKVQDFYPVVFNDVKDIPKAFIAVATIKDGLCKRDCDRASHLIKKGEIEHGYLSGRVKHRVYINPTFMSKQGVVGISMFRDRLIALRDFKVTETMKAQALLPISASKEKFDLLEPVVTVTKQDPIDATISALEIPEATPELCSGKIATRADRILTLLETVVKSHSELANMIGVISETMKSFKSQARA